MTDEKNLERRVKALEDKAYVDSGREEAQNRKLLDQMYNQEDEYMGISKKLEKTSEKTDEVVSQVAEISVSLHGVEVTVAEHTESIANVETDVQTVTERVTTVEQTAEGLTSTVTQHTQEISTLDNSVTAVTTYASQIDQKADGISLRVTQTESDIGGLETDMEGKANKATLVSEINLTPDTARISAEHIDIEGVGLDMHVQAVNIDGDVTANKFVGNFIETQNAKLLGDITAKTLTGVESGTEDTRSTNVTVQNMRVVNGILKASILISDTYFESYTGDVSFYYRWGYYEDNSSINRNVYHIVVSGNATVHFDSQRSGVLSEYDIVQIPEKVYVTHTYGSGGTNSYNYAPTNPNSFVFSGNFTTSRGSSSGSVSHYSNVEDGTYALGMCATESGTYSASLTQTVVCESDSNDRVININSHAVPAKHNTYDLGANISGGSVNLTITLNSAEWADGSSYRNLPADVKVSYNIQCDDPSVSKVNGEFDFYIRTRGMTSGVTSHSCHLSFTGVELTNGTASAVSVVTVDGTATNRYVDNVGFNSTGTTKTSTITGAVSSLVSYWRDAYIMNPVQTGSARIFKEEISDIDSRYIDFAKLLIPRRYKYKDGTSGRTHIGFIVDEVGTAMQQAGLDSVDFAGYCLADTDKPNGAGCLRYEEFIAILLAYIQQLESRVAALEEERTNI